MSLFSFLSGRRQTGSDRMLAEAVSDNNRLKAEAKRLATELDSMRRRLEYISESVQSIESRARSSETALFAAQEELRVYKEVTIPGMAASAALLTARWESETAVHAMRINAGRGRESEE